MQSKGCTVDIQTKPQVRQKRLSKIKRNPVGQVGHWRELGKDSFIFLSGGRDCTPIKDNGNCGHLSSAIWESPPAAVGTKANVTCA